MSYIKIELVKTKEDLKRFIAVANKPYIDDPNYVIPLMLERLEALQAKTNPYFEHAEVQYFIATLDGEDVGRISAQIDTLVQENMEAGLGHFGLFEAMSEDAAHMLLNTAEIWLKTRGIKRMQGPWSLSSNQESGLLVDGFDTPPVIMMPHGRPEYKTWFESYGFAKEKDLYSYGMEIAAEHSERSARFEQMARKNKRLKPRNVDMKNYKAEIDTILDIFNDAWSGNWGYIPMTEHEIDHLAKSLKPIIKKDRAYIYEVDGKPSAFMITIPDVNHYIAPLKGKLLPFGWAKMVWHLFLSNQHPRLRVPLMGVRKEFQKTPLGAAMAISMIENTRDSVYKKGSRFVEMGWILEDNTGMRSMIEMVHGEIYKTYRIYTKDI